MSARGELRAWGVTGLDAADQGRVDLAGWLAARPSNYLDGASHLTALLESSAGTARALAFAPRLASFGHAVATVVEPAVAMLERHRGLPAHVPYDAIGRRVEAIEFHPAYADIGRVVWGSGLLAVNRGGTGAYEQAALFYLLSHAGEGGHACPVVCTAGLARAVERRGGRNLVDAYLDGLFAADYDACLRGSQFLTEVQSGSDVGRNATVAAPDSGVDGGWRLTGEKWFCSVADADLFAVTARPIGAAAGTRGLGCFLVPRTLDGVTPNGFRIRRLKDKLGTRCLASAEIDFEAALGWPIGELDEGFHVAVEELLNTSRWLNAVGSTGLMRRAYVDASSFARHRHAFGRAVGAFPIVREQLSSMKVDEHAALASTFALTGLRERIDAGTATPEELAAHRVLVNANKYVTSIDATDVVHRGIEVLGGNGTIEDFSALPRLYRDAIVYESWEGTHNVLCAQVLRDLARSDTLDAFAAWLEDELNSHHAVPEVVVGTFEETLARLRAMVAAPESNPGGFRNLLGSIVRLVQASSLARLAAHRSSNESTAVLEVFSRRHFGRDDNLTVAPTTVDVIVAPDLDG